MKHVAGKDGAARIGLLALAPDRDRRLEPLAEAHFDDALAHPPGDVFVRGLAGRDHLVRERLANHHVRDLHRVAIGLELLGKLHFEPADREHLRRLDLGGVRGTECFDEAALFIRGDAVGVVPRIGFVDADDLGILLVDELAQPFVLAVVRRRHHRVKPVVIEAADRIALDGLAAAGVVEDEDGAPPRCEVGERRHRREHRVLVVFACRDDPHVDPLARHQRAEQRVEPLLDPRRDERVLLTMREHALRGIGILTDCASARDRQDTSSDADDATNRLIMATSLAARQVTRRHGEHGATREMPMPLRATAHLESGLRVSVSPCFTCVSSQGQNLPCERHHPDALAGQCRDRIRNSRRDRGQRRLAEAGRPQADSG